VGPTSKGEKARAKARQRAPLWTRLAIGFGALLMVLSGGSLVAGKLLLVHYGDDLTHDGGLGNAGATGRSIDGPINLLLVGIDEGSGRVEEPRADSIIVAHIPATHDAIYLASVPRDSRVTIPANRSTDYPGGTDKINAAFKAGFQNGGGREGGLALLAETISNLTSARLKFNGAAIVNFDGFKDLVKAIGGVRMYVDEKVTSIHIGTNAKTGEVDAPFDINPDGTVARQRPNMRPMVYEVGWHDFKDWQALDYVRQRDLLENGDSDYGRQRHQQQFMKAVFHKTTSTGVITNPVKVNKVLKSVGKAVTFYNNDISIADWIFTLKDIKPDNMTMIKTNGGAFNPVTVDGVSYETLTPDSLQLFRDMGADDMASFVSTHQSWISTDTSPG
jgi:LCP family protein required for cell wall assembly